MWQMGIGSLTADAFDGGVVVLLDMNLGDYVTVVASAELLS
jgi:hypothetical protein